MPGPDDGLRALFRKNVTRAHWQTIEHLLDRGVPDANVCIEGHDVWIEFKATKAWGVRMRPEQVGWLLARHRHGGSTVIAVRRRRPGVDQLWLVRGHGAELVQSCGLTPWINASARDSAFLGMWEGGPSRWRWDLVRGALMSA